MISVCRWHDLVHRQSKEPHTHPAQTIRANRGVPQGFRTTRSMYKDQTHWLEHEHEQPKNEIEKTIPFIIVSKEQNSCK